MQTAIVAATFVQDDQHIRREWNLRLDEESQTYTVIEYRSFRTDIPDATNPRPLVYREAGIYDEAEIGIGRPMKLDCLDMAEEIFYNGNPTQIM